MNIIICDSCNGEGKRDQSSSSKWNEYETVKCGRCNGTGRLRKLMYTITFPFNHRIDDVYEASKEMVDLKRKYEK